MKKQIAFIVCIFFTALSYAQKDSTLKKKDRKRDVLLQTSMGDIVIRLSDSTPLHRDNFLKLVKVGFYDSILFHRVIKDFMIQGGDPESKNAPSGIQLGNGDVGFTIPAEFDSILIHKKGALAAARMGDDINPKKESSGCQFYIVQGKKWTEQELQMMEMQLGRKYTAAQKYIYKTTGGTPFLDMNYTVFGEVETGFNVIDKIARVQKDQNDRPLADLRMKIEVIK
jgi:peptidyl-prolyl cis-trans isomerase B (cyclophilin B)